MSSFRPLKHIHKGRDVDFNYFLNQLPHHNYNIRADLLKRNSCCSSFNFNTFADSFWVKHSRAFLFFPFFELFFSLFLNIGIIIMDFYSNGVVGVSNTILNNVNTFANSPSPYFKNPLQILPVPSACVFYRVYMLFFTPSFVISTFTIGVRWPGWLLLSFVDVIHMWKHPKS